ncbi:MAG TPA: SOS response-associated peptidase, partial [Thermodesulfobacteriota bacterium]
MPGRFSLTIELQALKNRFRFSSSVITLNPRYNIAPGQFSSIVMRDDKNSLKMMKWGLIPSWTKYVSNGNKPMINARAETITQKPSFKNSFKAKRCLVLADGFYEWDKNEKKGSKIPYRFVLRSREPFAFAGLWDVCKNPEGEVLLTFTIITTEANNLIRPIHERMPVILSDEDEDLWLDQDIDDLDKLLSLLVPFPGDQMKAYKVSTVVNSPANDTPS